jgi:hypothetical protein
MTQDDTDSRNFSLASHRWLSDLSDLSGGNGKYWEDIRKTRQIRPTNLNTGDAFVV